MLKKIQSLSKRPLLVSAFIITAVVWIAHWQYNNYQLSHPNRTHSEIPVTTHMKTICVGRLLLDVPAESRITLGEFIVDGTSIGVEQNVTQYQFERRMQARWQEINAWAPDKWSVQFTRKPAEQITPFENSVIFMSREQNLSYDDKKPQYVHDTEGYLWRDGAVYSFDKKLSAEKKIITMMGRIHSRPGDALPAGPGLCNAATFIPDDGAWHDEQIRLNIDLPNLNTSIGILVEGVDGEPPKRLLERKKQRALNVAQDLAAWAEQNPGEQIGETTFRRAQRQVGRWLGDELVGGEADNQGGEGFSTQISAIWEFPGESRSLSSPNIQLKMNSNYAATSATRPLGSFPKNVISGQGRLTETEFFTLWDKMTDSLRLRPGAA